MDENSDNVAQTPKRKRRLTPKNVAMSLRRHYGVLTKVADSLGVTRQAVQNYIRRYPALINIQNEARETIVDLAEDGLIGGIQTGEQWAIGLALRTLGKNRGYVEKAPEVDETRKPEPLVIEKDETPPDRPTE